MTPLHLEILLWYYARANDFPFEGNSTRLDYAEDLRVEGMLSHDGRYHISEKGKFWIEQVLSLPYPVRYWKMPDTN